MCGLTSLRWRPQAMKPQRDPSTIFWSAAMPPHSIRFPTMVFTDVTQSGASESMRAARRCEPTSMASARKRPAPWASTASMSPGSTPAWRTASWMTSCSATPLGVDMLAHLPLVLRLTPARTPTTGYFSSCTYLPSTSSQSGFSEAAAQPSPRTKPEAQASKAMQRPLRESQPSAPCCAHHVGESMSCAPMPTPRSEVRLRPLGWTDSAVMKMAVRLEDWSVSRAMLGPFIPMTKESRFAATQPAPPVGPQPEQSAHFSTKPQSPNEWPT
mmetsp:Transcript_64786/g.208647  ORF Transcript_64786/g.208647 Transcript_64786/m.208647 type:complete len:270 (-) Transcript_64786:1196-2005(-)